MICAGSCLLRKRAAALFNLSISPCLYGSHTGQEYSKSDRTIEKYAISFNLVGHPFKFLLKKPPV